jgi:RNA polymerase sigma-70 factor (ECF subfamily)
MEDADKPDVEASRRGDAEAYARLVKRYQDAIATRMWRFTRDRRTLEELVQNVFVEAYFGLAGFRGSAPFSHWLNRIATRVGYQYWKFQKRRARHEVVLQDWDALAARPDGLEPQQAAEVLHSLLAKMPPRDRLVLTLLYVEELSVAQAADRTGWSKVMIKVQAHRARKKLRALLEKAGMTDILKETEK